MAFSHCEKGKHKLCQTEVTTLQGSLAAVEEQIRARAQAWNLKGYWVGGAFHELSI